MKFFRLFRRKSNRPKNSTPAVVAVAPATINNDAVIPASASKRKAVEVVRPPVMQESVPVIGMSPAPFAIQAVDRTKQKASGGIFSSREQKKKPKKADAYTRQRISILERKILELKREKRAQAQQKEEDRLHLRQKLQRAKWKALKQEQAAMERLDKCSRAEVMDYTVLEKKYLQEKAMRKSMEDSALKFSRQKEGLLEQRHEYVEKIRKLMEHNRKLRHMILDMGMTPEDMPETDLEDSRRVSPSHSLDALPSTSTPDQPPTSLDNPDATVAVCHPRLSVPPVSLTPLLELRTPASFTLSPMSQGELNISSESSLPASHLTSQSSIVYVLSPDLSDATPVFAAVSPVISPALQSPPIHYAEPSSSNDDAEAVSTPPLPSPIVSSYESEGSDVPVSSAAPEADDVAPLAADAVDEQGQIIKVGGMHEPPPRSEA
eukprot:TRINITY_DN2311_c0_g1_i4.p1 TRINITY_DN2311_c0_g1~~TRINITY_DN2311_c0_g1_i4.p1  ORF type:complete len:434 (-),score=122.12 TRINITY_DN2311_c0_g1_i4:13-1314(-)